jgi:hypothetical protein
VRSRGQSLTRGAVFPVSLMDVAYKMAISSSAKRFVASPIVQSVVTDIYSGRVIYSSASSANRSIVADNYKLRDIEIYDSKNAPWLNHYRCGLSFWIPRPRVLHATFVLRLRVPRYGAILEFLNFALLLVVFVLCLSRKYLFICCTSASPLLQIKTSMRSTPLKFSSSSLP